MATNGRPVQSGGATGDDTSTHYTSTTGDYSDPDIREDPDMHGMRHDYDGVMRRQRMMSRATKTGATWEGERSYGEDWDASDMDPQKFRSKARGIARGQGGGYGQGRQGGGDAIHELIPIYIPSPGMDSTISRGGSDPDGISGDTLAVIINNQGGEGESHKHHKGEKDMYGMGTDNGFLAGLLAGGGGNKGGVDASTLAYLGQCKDNGMWGGDSLALIILLLLLGAGGRGFGGLGGGYGGNGGDCCAGMLSEKNTGLVLDAIGTNGIRQEAAINALSSNLNCDVNSIKSTLCSLAQNQAVLSGDIKGAIQACCCNLGNQLQQVNCNLGHAIERQGCDTREAIAGVNYNLASQFAAQNSLMQSIACQQDRALADCCCDIKQTLTAGFAGIESREQAREIASLRDQLAQERASAQTAVLLSAINRTRQFNGQYDAATTSFTGAVGQVSQFSV